MPVFPLDQNTLDSVYNKVRNIFLPDFFLFDEIVGGYIRQILINSNRTEINTLSLKNATREFKPDLTKYNFNPSPHAQKQNNNSFNGTSSTKNEGKDIIKKAKLIVRVTFVILLSHQPIRHELDYDQEQMTTEYYDIKEFAELLSSNTEADREEMKYLLNFRNALKLALNVIPARLNKQVLLKIAAKLEGSSHEYVTGGGQTVATTRRVIIYEKEGRITAKKRPKQSSALVNPHSNHTGSDEEDEEDDEEEDEDRKRKAIKKQQSKATKNQVQYPKPPVVNVPYADSNQIGIPSRQLSNVSNTSGDWINCFDNMPLSPSISLMRCFSNRTELQQLTRTSAVGDDSMAFSDPLNNYNQQLFSTTQTNAFANYNTANTTAFNTSFNSLSNSINNNNNFITLANLSSLSNANNSNGNSSVSIAPSYPIPSMPMTLPSRQNSLTSNASGINRPSLSRQVSLRISDEVYNGLMGEDLDSFIESFVAETMGENDVNKD
eukprot:gene8210-11110_t